MLVVAAWFVFLSGSGASGLAGPNRTPTVTSLREAADLPPTCLTKVGVSRHRAMRDSESGSEKESSRRRIPYRTDL